MIILGVVFYLAFYGVALKWYVGLCYKNDLDRPYNFRKAWFFPSVATISLVLFGASSLSFFVVSPWLALIPFGLLVFSSYWIRMRRGARIKLAVQAAVQCQHHLAARQADQVTINREIMRQLLGEETSGSWIAEVDTKTLLKCAVLPELGLYQVEQDMRQKERNPRKPTSGDVIDALFDFYMRVASYKPGVPS